jgi:hypothetical protein
VPRSCHGCPGSSPSAAQMLVGVGRPAHRPGRDPVPARHLARPRQRHQRADRRTQAGRRAAARLAWRPRTRRASPGSCASHSRWRQPAARACRHTARCHRSDSRHPQRPDPRRHQGGRPAAGRGQPPGHCGSDHPRRRRHLRHPPRNPRPHRSGRPAPARPAGRCQCHTRRVNAGDIQHPLTCRWRPSLRDGLDQPSARRAGPRLLPPEHDHRLRCRTRRERHRTGSVGDREK